MNPFEELDKFTRTIERVHGASHPELIEVRSLFLTIQEKVKKLEDPTASLARLEVVTDHYTPPADACQAYEKTYRLLKEMAGNL